MQVISFSPCPLTPPSFEASALVRAATFYLFPKPTTCIGHERWSLNSKTSAEISLIHNFASQSAIWGMQGLNVLIYCLPRRADEKKAGRGCNQEESKIQNPSRRNVGKGIYCIPLHMYIYTGCSLLSIDLYQLGNPLPTARQAWYHPGVRWWLKRVTLRTGGHAPLNLPFRCLDVNRCKVVDFLLPMWRWAP